MSKSAPDGVILVTGFEPFGGDPVNPSSMLAAALDGRRLRHGARTLKIVGRELPCAFDSASAALVREVDRWEPELVLCTGLAAGRSSLSFERVAINLVDARIADNTGVQPIDRRVIAATRRDAYFSTLPVKAMVQASLAQGVSAELSLSAGTYVCNAVFFTLMHTLAKSRRASGAPSRRPRGAKSGGSLGRRGGFVHLPCLPEQAQRMGGQPAMSLDDMVQGVQAALDVALRVDLDLAIAGGTIA
jgi:pyroglutamyl-peptidase